MVPVARAGQGRGYGASTPPRRLPSTGARLQQARGHAASPHTCARVDQHQIIEIPAGIQREVPTGTRQRVAAGLGAHCCPRPPRALGPPPRHSPVLLRRAVQLPAVASKDEDAVGAQRVHARAVRGAVQQAVVALQLRAAHGAGGGAEHKAVAVDRVLVAAANDPHVPVDHRHAVVAAGGRRAGAAGDAMPLGWWWKGRQGRLGSAADECARAARRAHLRGGGVHLSSTTLQRPVAVSKDQMSRKTMPPLQAGWRGEVRGGQKQGALTALAQCKPAPSPPAASEQQQLAIKGAGGVACASQRAERLLLPPHSNGSSACGSACRQRRRRRRRGRPRKLAHGPRGHGLRWGCCALLVRLSDARSTPAGVLRSGCQALEASPGASCVFEVAAKSGDGEQRGASAPQSLRWLRCARGFAGSGRRAPPVCMVLQACQPLNKSISACIMQAVLASALRLHLRRVTRTLFPAPLRCVSLPDATPSLLPPRAPLGMEALHGGKAEGQALPVLRGSVNARRRGWGSRQGRRAGGRASCMDVAVRLVHGRITGLNSRNRGVQYETGLAGLMCLVWVGGGAGGQGGLVFCRHVKGEWSIKRASREQRRATA